MPGLPSAPVVVATPGACAYRLTLEHGEAVEAPLPSRLLSAS